MSIGNRIKKIRRELDLTQMEFASRIGSTQNTITRYETGSRVPSSSGISLICREFNINENWLRTGEGEMFIKSTRQEEISRFIDGLSTQEQNNFKLRLITALSRLDESDWITLEKLAQSMYQDSQIRPVTSSHRCAPDEMSDDEVRAELERQLAEEKEIPDASSVSGDGSSGTVAG